MMPHTPLHAWQAKLDAGEITAVDLARQYLDRIEAHNGQLNAFVHLDADHVLDQAAASDAHRAKHGAGDRLIFSFHGTPRRFLEEGDPYYHQCLATAAGVAGRLALAPEQWQVTFQSRFGREEWLQPYTDVTLQELGAAGVGRIDILCPGFSADCLETLEEVAITNRRLFLEAGGRDYHYIPALNTRDDHIAALAAVVERHIAGWE